VTDKLSILQQHLDYNLLPDVALSRINSILASSAEEAMSKPKILGKRETHKHWPPEIVEASKNSKKAF
jgi:hypothetical protein